MNITKNHGLQRTMDWLCYRKLWVICENLSCALCHSYRSNNSDKYIIEYHPKGLVRMSWLNINVTKLPLFHSQVLCSACYLQIPYVVEKCQEFITTHGHVTPSGASSMSIPAGAMLQDFQRRAAYNKTVNQVNSLWYWLVWKSMFTARLWSLGPPNLPERFWKLLRLPAPMHKQSIRVLPFYFSFSQF